MTAEYLSFIIFLLVTCHNSSSAGSPKDVLGGKDEMRKSLCIQVKFSENDNFKKILFLVAFCKLQHSSS